MVLCKCGCGKSTKLVGKGDLKRGLKAGEYRAYASHECYLRDRRANAKTHCDYGHEMTTKVVKGKERKYCRRCNTARRLALKSGMTVLEILSEEDNRGKPCEICQLKPGTHFDHNHETGSFRGWLCNECNSALGLFKDSPDIVLRALKYLVDKGSYGQHWGDKTELKPEQVYDFKIDYKGL